VVPRAMGDEATLDLGLLGEVSGCAVLLLLDEPNEAAVLPDSCVFGLARAFRGSTFS
jgi:hypothetical protein